jgi:biopolymer transport protein ExbB/TolQ
MFAQRNNHIVLGAAMAIGLSIIVCLGYYSTPAGSTINTVFFALGGRMPDGLIQTAAFACFFTCLLGMRRIGERLGREEKAFGAKLLPETEQYVLYPEDVNRIKLETIDVEKRQGPSLLTDLIKQATTKFRATNSPADTLTMVETVTDMQRKEIEKEFWLVNTCQTLIPMFGFLGTVWGIATTVMAMGKPQPTAMATVTPSTVTTTAGAAKTVTTTAPAATNAITSADIQVIIDHMGMAFFATMLAMVLTIIVNILLRRHEARAEDFQMGVKRYVVENLVNRIHL